LAQRKALGVPYRNAEGERAEAVIHPQALVQRGPVPYIFALKNDEDEPLRLCALHRMIRATVLTGTPASFPGTARSIMKRNKCGLMHPAPR
jgi:hypothetical protein